MSGADDAASVAERRKLQAELTEAKEELNDTYYDHAKDQQSQALDDEATAYEESMNNYVEKLRTTLEEATVNMETFMQAVTASVMANAGTVKEEYINTGAALDEAILTPWDDAITKMQEFETDGLSMMNAWTAEDGFFAKFDANATEALSSPWSAGIDAANTFREDVFTAMSQVVGDVKSNVVAAQGNLADLYQDIVDTQNKINSIDTTPGNTNKTPTPLKPPPSRPTPDTTPRKTLYTETKVVMSPVYVDGAGTEYYKLSGFSDAYVTKGSTMNRSGKLYAVEGSYYYKAADKNLKKKATKNPSVKAGGVTYSAYAKGTLGTTKDEFAITDESWIGEEITLAAGKNGQLQYLKKGSAVMPADISTNLVEWGKLNPNMMNVGGSPNLNMISNAVNKPEFNISFDALVKAENITEETLPAVKKLVTQELNRFTKELNYALKGKGAR